MLQFKGVHQRTFLFQLTNDLCRSFTKIVISIFCAKNKTNIKVLFQFLEFVRLYRVEQCHHARGKLVPIV